MQPHDAASGFKLTKQGPVCSLGSGAGDLHGKLAHNDDRRGDAALLMQSNMNIRHA